MANQIFTRLDTAASKALANSNKVFGFQTDPDLRRYEQLGDNDFQTLVGTYGQDAVTGYVQTMEARRMRGGKYA